jgi:acyl carrier protein
MEKFLEEMAEILEVDSVNPQDIFTEFEAWDSLTQLSIISLADSHYGVTISALELKEIKDIAGIKKLIDSKK